MVKTIEIDEVVAFEKDVTTMSYDELMASIRYLDKEREIIARRVRGQSEDNNSTEGNNSVETAKDTL